MSAELIIDRAAVAEGPQGGAATSIVINPLEALDWDSAVTELGGCFFHSRSWAQVLAATYRHRPLYCAQQQQGRPTAILPLMELRSPILGSRGVSLPFTDACEPLSRTDEAAVPLYELAREQGLARQWRYLEFRSPVRRWRQPRPSVQFLEHVLPLTDGPEGVSAQFDPAVRRAVRKAERAGLTARCDTTPEAIADYFRLHCLTRKRHGLPPQPVRFFENIARYVLGAGNGFVVSALLANRVVAAAVFFFSGTRAIYKFGASDAAFQELRPNNLVMAEAIKWFAGHGFEQLDLGRTSLNNAGLARFKRSFGAIERRLEYFRYSLPDERWVTSIDRAAGWANAVFRRLPVPALRLAGRLLYPHVS